MADANSDVESIPMGDDEDRIASLTTSDEDADDESEQLSCPICLEAIAAKDVVRTRCGHAFCTDCVGKLREHAGNNFPCPCCKRPRAMAGSSPRPRNGGGGGGGGGDDDDDDLEAELQRRIEHSRTLLRTLGTTTTTNGGGAGGGGGDSDSDDDVVEMQRRLEALRTPHGTPRPGRTADWWNAGQRERPDAEAQRALARAAGRTILRYCPGCHTPIAKNGGCPQMSCPCGMRFRWYDARPIRPCVECHVDSDEGPIGRWKTCRYCSNAAKAKCAALKVGTAAGMVPVATAAVGVGVTAAAAAVTVGATIAAVPAVTIGPFALAYEPVRRLRKKKSNPLAKAAASGAKLVGDGAVMCLLAMDGDSD